MSSISISSIVPEECPVGQETQFQVKGSGLDTPGLKFSVNGQDFQVVGSPTSQSATLKLVVDANSGIGWKKVSVSRNGTAVSIAPETELFFSASSTDRKDFLLHVYDQAWRNVASHVALVWQAIGVLVGTVALFSLVEKKVLPLDIAATLAILVATWFIQHVYDAWEWFHRNMQLLTNVERQFLRHSDQKIIHHFFKRHLLTTKMPAHFKLQAFLGYGLATIVFAFHLSERVFKERFDPSSASEYLRFAPLIAVACGIGAVIFTFQRVVSDNKDLNKEAPGLEVKRMVETDS